MKKHLSAVLLISGLLAASVAAQTPAAPTPAYLDFSLPEAQRLPLVQAAQAALTSTSAPADVEVITSQLDYLLLNTATAWADVQPLAENLLATHGAFLTGTLASAMQPVHKDSLFVQAAHTKQRLAFATSADRAAFMLTVIGSLTDAESDSVINLLNDYYLLAVCWSAEDLIAAGQYDQAVAVSLQPALLNNPRFVYNTLAFALKAKTLAHAPDTLAVAKLVYVSASFADSQAASVLVANAFRAVDGNFTRANAFIAAQTDATATNPLAGIEVPAAYKAGPLPEPQYAATNLLLKGDKVGALRSARTGYDSASDNDALNTAVGTVAVVLRDADLNLIRANAYVAAQKSGQTYPIAELQ